VAVVVDMQVAAANTGNLKSSRFAYGREAYMLRRPRIKGVLGA